MLTWLAVPAWPVLAVSAVPSSADAELDQEPKQIGEGAPESSAAAQQRLDLLQLAGAAGLAAAATAAAVLHHLHLVPAVGGQLLHGVGHGAAAVNAGAGLGRGGDGSVGGGSIAAVRQQLVHVLLAELSTGEKEIVWDLKTPRTFNIIEVLLVL